MAWQAWRSGNTLEALKPGKRLEQDPGAVCHFWPYSLPYCHGVLAQARGSAGTQAGHKAQAPGHTLAQLLPVAMAPEMQQTLALCPRSALAYAPCCGVSLKDIASQSFDIFCQSALFQVF